MTARSRIFAEAAETLVGGPNSSIIAVPVEIQKEEPPAEPAPQ